MSDWVSMEAQGYDNPGLYCSIEVLAGAGSLSIRNVRGKNTGSGQNVRWCGAASVHASVNDVSHGSIAFTGMAFGVYGISANCSGTSCPCTSDSMASAASHSTWYNAQPSNARHTCACAGSAYLPSQQHSTKPTAAQRISYKNPIGMNASTGWSVTGLEGYQTIMISFTPNFGNSKYNTFGRFFFGIDLGYPTCEVNFWSGSNLIKTEEVRVGESATPPAKNAVGMHHSSRRPFIGWNRSYSNILQSEVGGTRNIFAVYGELPVWIMSGNNWIPYDPPITPSGSLLRLSNIPNTHIWQSSSPASPPVPPPAQFPAPSLSCSCGCNRTLNYIHRMNGTGGSWVIDRRVHRAQNNTWNLLSI
jgi:hypothetical protein